MVLTQSQRDFLRDRDADADGPCLVVDVDVVADNYRCMSKALP
jgi:hypothetical protein